MHWNWDPILVDFGFLAIRWYGLCFALGVFLGMGAIQRSFRRRGLPDAQVASLCVWLVVGMVLGAHWGHMLFYEPWNIVRDPLSLLDPRQGLASHGGGIGAILALWLFSRKRKASFLEYADAVVVGAVWVLPAVRLGNFFNSEIYGRPTHVAWAVVFDRVDPLPRHPTQLYEVLMGLAIVAFAAWLDRRRERLQRGEIVCWALLAYFVLRFAVEFFKEYQVLHASFPLTMGQVLSLPFVAVFAIALWRLRRARRRASANR